MGPAAKVTEDGRLAVSVPAVGLALALLAACGGAAGWLLSTGAAKGEGMNMEGGAK